MILTTAHEASINAKSSEHRYPTLEHHSLHDGKTTHCQDRAEARRGRVGSPSQYPLVRDLPIARVESRGHRRHRALFVGAGSRARILRLRLGGRGVGLRRLVRRHGADRWVCWLCGR